MLNLDQLAVDPAIAIGVVLGLLLVLVYLFRVIPSERNLTDAIRLLFTSVGVVIGLQIMRTAVFDAELDITQAMWVYLFAGGFSALWACIGDIWKTLRG